MFRRTFLTAAVAVALALISPAVSQAGFTVYVSDGIGVGPDLVYTGTDGMINGQTQTLNLAQGAIDITITAFSNAPGEDGFAQITNQTLEIKKKNTGDTSAVTLTITALSDGLDGSFNLTEHFGDLRTVLTASTLKGDFASGVSNIDGSPVGSPLTLTRAEVAGGTNSKASTSEVTFGDSFTFGNTLTINLDATTGTAGANTVLGKVEIDSSIKAVPAPGGLIMAVTAVPFIGLIRRRLRKPVVANS